MWSRGGAALTCDLEQVSCLICHLCRFLTSLLIGVPGLIRGGGVAGDPEIFLSFFMKLEGGKEGRKEEKAGWSLDRRRRAVGITCLAALSSLLDTCPARPPFFSLVIFFPLSHPCFLPFLPPSCPSCSVTVSSLPPHATGDDHPPPSFAPSPEPH